MFLSVSTLGQRWLKPELCGIWVVFLTIIRDHVGWSFTGNRRQKKMSDFWPKKWSRSLQKFRAVVAYERVVETVFDWEAKRLFRKWSLTGGGRLGATVNSVTATTSRLAKYRPFVPQPFHRRGAPADPIGDVFDTKGPFTDNRVLRNSTETWTMKNKPDPYIYP